ncbi:MAG TPA: amidohydrolase family protein [Actinomycetota bacterium]
MSHRSSASLPLASYRPRSSLRTASTPVDRTRFPAVDAHNHLGRWLTDDWAAPDVGALLDLMDRCNLAAIVNLDGRWGAELEANLDRYDRAHPGRFATFAQLDWRATTESAFGERLADQVRRQADTGARGLKVWKDLGLHLTDDEGVRLAPDDLRLAPVWEAAADVALPVLIHTGDPLAFFEPLDERNERLEELTQHPEWWFGDRARFPGFDDLLVSFERLVAQHPRTTFIGAHVAGAAEDLAWVDRMLTTYANLHVDIAARIAELGRQPRAARALIEGHPTRVLFGTDEFPPMQETYAIHVRFLETADEHFAYSLDDPPPQGRWAISGLALSDELLSGVYRDNAARLIPGLVVPGSS